jgi:RNA polymerase sigma-70 factor (ECF subfamily)
MTDLQALAARFEPERAHLHAVAFRMLGSVSDADDAVQETWLRLSRDGAAEIRNLPGWLTTVVARVCLDVLRSRTARREDLVDRHRPDGYPDGSPAGRPEDEAVLVDEVGRALLVVLGTLSPAERIAFVLHDMFAVPFDQIAPVLGRSAGTTKKLGSRARLKVRGTPTVGTAELAGHRRTVERFLAASRSGDVEAILDVLDPDVVRVADPAALPPGRPRRVQGARTVTEEVAVFGARSRHAASALVDGDVGIVVAPHGRLQLVLALTFAGERIAGYELIADPARLAGLSLAAPPTGDGQAGASASNSTRVE